MADFLGQIVHPRGQVKWLAVCRVQNSDSCRSSTGRGGGGGRKEVVSSAGHS